MADVQTSKSTQDPRTIRAQVAGGAAILVVANILNRFIGLFSIAILARLLSPHDFGIASLALLVTEFVQMFTDLQLGNVLVQLGRDDPHLYDTAFTLAIFRGVFSSLCILICGLFSGPLLGEPDLVSMLSVLCLVPILDGLRSPRFIDFIKRVDFSRDAIVNLFGRLISLVITIAVAFYSPTYWALVAGAIASGISATILTHWMAPYLPRFELRDSKLFLRFGGWLSLASVTNYFSAKFDSLIIVGQYGVTTFGAYNLGVQAAILPTSQVAEPLQRAVFSGLVATGTDTPRRIRAYIRAQATILGLLLPVGFGVALVAHEIIAILAGAKWTAAILVIQFIAPAMAIAALSSGAQALMMAEGDTRGIFWRNIANIIIRIPLLLLASQLGGVAYLLTGALISAFIYTLLTLRMVAARHGFSTLAPVTEAWRSLLATTIMIVSVSLVGTAIATSDMTVLPNMASLVVKVVIGVVSLVSAQLALWHFSERPDGFERFVIGLVFANLRRLPIVKNFAG